MRTAQMKPGQLTYYAMLQAEISNDQPISETLKKMQSELIKLTEEQIVKIIHSLAIANNAKPLSSVRILNSETNWYLQPNNLL